MPPTMDADTLIGRPVGPMPQPASGGARLDLDIIPGPPPLPIVGAYGNMARFFVNNIRYAGMLQKNYGDIVMFTRGMPTGLMQVKPPAPAALFLFGSKLLEQVLIKTASSTFPDTVVGKMDPAMGGAARLTSGLLWLEGERHRQHRRMITPLYHQRTVQNYRDLMVSGIERMLDGFTPGSPVNLIEQAGRLLVEFENSFVLGEPETPDGKSGTLGDRLVQFYGIASHPLAQVPLDLPFTHRRKLRNMGDSLANELDGYLKARRANVKEGATDVLSMLINGHYEDGSKMSHEELVSETLHLFISGWVSTRASICWTALMLAQHPKLSADLHDELSSVLRGAAPTVEQLRQLPLLDAVIKESLRLFPAIPIVTRASFEAVELGGYRVPPRTELYLSIYHTHRAPDVYSEPLRFKPERWSSIQPGPYQYLPWGAGARTCLGNALATMQMKMLFAIMMQRYRLELPSGTKVDSGGIGIMVPKPELELLVRRQDREFQKSRAPLRGSIHEMVELA